MKEFWNDRYADKEYGYGEIPNQFFKEELQKLNPGRILLPAEGEGRNAVYAASLGWKVTAFDISTEGKKKADLLASKHGVEIDYHVCEFSEFEAEMESFDCIGAIFVHSDQKEQHHRLITKWLKSNGTVIFQAFGKGQLGRNSGGPQNESLLYSVDELTSDFKGLSHVEIQEIETTINEGAFHQGLAVLINLVGIK